VEISYIPFEWNGLGEFFRLLTAQKKKPHVGTGAEIFVS